MAVFKFVQGQETMHVIRQKDGVCENCSLWGPGDLSDLLRFHVREKGPRLHEVFLVRTENGALAAVCLYCSWGVRFVMGGGRDEIAKVAIGHIEAQRVTCMDCELAFRDEDIREQHDDIVHRRWGA